MARPRTPLDAWPLLPRRAPVAAERPEDEPVRAAFDAMVAIAAMLLALRWLLPDGRLAAEFAGQVAWWGGLGGLALTSAILALLAGAPLAMPLMDALGPLKATALRAFDHAVHLALVMSCSGMLAAIVLHGEVRVPALWFMGQAALLWGCHRTRIWLAGRSVA
jgi:hypothetical protein